MNKEDKKALDELTVMMTKDEAISTLKRINLNLERATRLIELDAPVVLLQNETRMIQRRAIMAASYYEEYKEIETAKIIKAEIIDSKSQ